MNKTETRSNSTPSVWHLIKSDLERYRFTDERDYLTALIMCPGVLAGITYRIGHWLWNYSGPLSPIMPIFQAIYIVCSRMTEIITGIRIAPRAKIGLGLYVGHADGVVIGGHVVMGNNCNIQQGVTIGTSSRGERQGSPILGDRVYVGPGAKMFGYIEIGSDVAVGANAVVTKSLPQRAVAVGIPAKVISLKGSFEYILYEGMDSDPERLASLDARDDSKPAAPAKPRHRIPCDIIYPIDYDETDQSERKRLG